MLLSKQFKTLLLLFICFGLLSQIACINAQNVQKTQLSEKQIEAETTKTDTTIQGNWQIIKNPHESVESLHLGIDGTEEMHRFKIFIRENTKVTEENVWEVVKPLIQFNDRDEELKRIERFNVKWHKRYQVYNNDVKVLSNIFFLGIKNEFITNVSGFYEKNIKLENKNFISSATALNYAIDHIKNKFKSNDYKVTITKNTYDHNQIYELSFYKNQYFYDLYVGGDKRILENGRSVEVIAQRVRVNAVNGEIITSLSSLTHP